MFSTILPRDMNQKDVFTPDNNETHTILACVRSFLEEKGVAQEDNQTICEALSRNLSSMEKISETAMNHFGQYWHPQSWPTKRRKEDDEGEVKGISYSFVSSLSG